MNTDETLSPHEILARKFVQWKREYSGRVDAAFRRQDRTTGLSEFNAWQHGFVSFLRKEAPSLLQFYERNIKGVAVNLPTDGILSMNWKLHKGIAIETFLEMAIEQAHDEKSLLQTPMNNSEELTPHEILARKFLEWQKEYIEVVHAAFMRQDRHTGEIAFDTWEQRFLPFLENEAPSLIPVYKKNVQGKVVRMMFDDTVATSWARSKGDSIHSFLDLAIKEARAKHLIAETNEFHVMATPITKPNKAGKIFIGHGRSHAWRDLKDFLQERLHLQIDEFNREATAGHTTVERLKRMLDEASFAFLVMTAEDEHGDQKLHARQNVIHEIGLFQGKLGFDKAIILLEEGCERFSNIEGLTYIPFPKGDIEAASEKIRRVLEREGILK